ncbi:HlyD family efflux transporter periplasmic adaptor subunit [Chloroflexus aggregans]|uniref:Secretion protein HlyD family protein n=1 Tax=Chloroflexus aggregans (strain MD-66 / DSM 9485) TaxID=326427 RepID=B8G590_CHLAD|nr:efflux RND transporter periplasmic adaptor subunit [Chloroflexus aggregans]ACL25596.1 secretion protein HlyD family protein [Chloroflexus aggregans DSM 9485]
MRKLIIPLIAVILILGGAYAIFGPNGPGAQSAPPPIPTGDTVVPPVSVEGRVVPLQYAWLRFERSGMVSAILVAEGDQVAAGQALAQLDDRAQRLAVQQAEANLARAQARYAQLLAGAAPETRAAAEAAVQVAAAQATQVALSVAAPDEKAALAQLAEAKAARAELLAGADPEVVAQAQAARDQAAANLAAQRSALAAAKVNAQLAVEQAANVLRDRQADYSRIHWENEELKQRLGEDELPQARIDLEAAALHAVQNAEVALAQARINAEQAVQAEIEGIAAAEARLREAEARLAALLSPPAADKLAAIDARIAAAEATLARLRGDPRQAQVAVAQAQVALAQAQAAQVNAAPREEEVALAQAEVAAAEAALAQARLELDKLTLRAPFAGTVARLELRLGELATPTAPALLLGDLSVWRIETIDLNEIDAARIAPGAAVTVTFDALPGVALPGRVIAIEPYGTDRLGEVVYTATIELTQTDQRLHWNMTAVITFNGS